MFSIEISMQNKRGVSAVVATIFLVLITITAVSIIWGTVIPFIKGNLDLEQRQVDLRIITENGYTVYDADEGMAFVQVERGADNVTLHGMEMMIDFNGTTYKTTLRAPTPNAQKTYFFDMKEMKTKGYLPKTVSVSPVFIRDNRQILGEITSYVNLPILNIVKSYTDILIELKADDVAVVNVTEANKTISNLCDSFVGEDPWGGCPIASGDMLKVTSGYASIRSIYSIQNVSASWAGKKLKVKGGNCVNVSYDGNSINGCVSIYGTPNEASNYTSINTPGVVNVLACTGSNWYYIYDSADCK